MAELDSWDFKSESSFDEVIDSDWVTSLASAASNVHKHYLLQTYDHVFEIISTNHIIELMIDDRHGVNV